MNIRRIMMLAASGMFAAVTLVAGSAVASTTVVDSCAGGNKAFAIFSVGADIFSCGSGNINGSDGNDAFLDNANYSDYQSPALYKLNSSGALDEETPGLTPSLTTNSDNHLVFSFSPLASFTDYVFGIKQGNGFALVNLNGLTSLEFGTANATGGTYGSDYSHINLYGVPATVPVPAAGFLLAGALGGLGLMRRRRRAT